MFRHRFHVGGRMRVSSFALSSALVALCSMACGCRSHLSCTEPCVETCTAPCCCAGCCSAPATDGGVASAAPQDELSANIDGTGSPGDTNAGGANQGIDAPAGAPEVPQI